MKRHMTAISKAKPPIIFLFLEVAALIVLPGCFDMGVCGRKGMRL